MPTKTVLRRFLSRISKEMILFGRLYRVIWPGPSRIKAKRCFALCGLMIVLLTFYLLVQIHSSSDILNGANDIEKNNPKSPQNAVGMSLEMSSWPLMATETFDVPEDNNADFLDEQRNLNAMLDIEKDALLPVPTTLKSTTTSTNSEEDLLAEVESNEKSYTTSPTTVTYATKQKIKKRKLLNVPNYWNGVKSYNFRSANFVKIQNGGLQSAKKTTNGQQKHLFILGHYEQLGKTTINYMEAARLAFLTNRKIVKPFVKGSRFCGLTAGWTGSLRSGTRLFQPLDLYYNITFLAEFFRQHKLADMEYLENFIDDCSFKKRQQKIVIVYFMYSDLAMKYFGMKDKESKALNLLLNQSAGWVDCSFINDHLNVDKRISNEFKVGKQYCVAPEKVVDIAVLEDKILRNEQCVVFHQWRGTGHHRTHFNTTIASSAEGLLKYIRPSDYIISEVLRFLGKMSSTFIGIHIRSERQLLWYGIGKLMKCMDLLYREVQKLRNRKRIESVFISADIGPFGSDQIAPNFNKSQLRTIKTKYDWLVRKLNATTYSVLRQRHHIWTDNGLVGLVQANILSQASLLVTLGAGTFQRWITDTFKARKEMANDNKWTITRVCFSENKGWQMAKRMKSHKAKS